RHGAPGSPGADVRPGRTAWASALRLGWVSIVSRATCSAGSSRSSLPPASCRTPSTSVQDDQRVALVHRLPLLDEDLLDGPVVLGLHRHLHLHRLEDHHGVALGDAVADLDLDLP